jgi:hypothetical protein
MKKTLSGLCAGISLLVVAPGAHAAPVTVNVRVEGPTSTLFEAPVTTDVRTFRFTGDATEHQCDGTAATGGTSPVAAPVRNGALLTGLERAAIPVHGSFSQYGASFSDIGGVSVAYDAGTSKYLVEYLNGAASQLGGCSETIKDGDDVLYAYATGSESVLKLSGPAVVAPGGSAALKVTDAATGAPVAGAQIGAVVTGADGTASVGPYTARGTQPALKATKDGAIRSNAFAVCVSDGADGECGTVKPIVPAKIAPVSRITGLQDGARFARGKGPRVLGGTADGGRAAIRAVKIRLTRTGSGPCQRFDVQRERFVRQRRCGASHASFAAVSTAAQWSYQLPSRLPRGRYVLDIRTVNTAGDADFTLVRNRNRVVFHVA